MTAKELKKLRAATGLSQSGFARVADVSVRAIQDWEQGHRRMGVISEKWLRHNLAVYQDGLARAGKLKKPFL